MKNKLEYRIENGSLIIDNYFNNLKIGSINGGSVENILNKCKLYDEEYGTLLKENEYMKHITKDFEQLQQKNNQLKLINKEHQQINGELRQANKLLNEQYIRLYKDYMQLKAQIEEYQKALDETMYEKIDIENNWNKLKEWVNKHYDYYINNEDYIGGRLCFIDIKDKMQELEQGSDRDE